MPYKSLAATPPPIGSLCSEQRLGETYTSSDSRLIVCKPAWDGTQNIYTFQYDSGLSSCPGGFQCGSGGGCWSCSLYNKCSQASFAFNNGSGYSCVAKLPTSTGTTTYPIVTVAPKPDGSSCLYGYECISNICNGVVWPDPYNNQYSSPTYQGAIPGTCAPSNTPTPTSTCSGTTGRVNGCTCTANTQCQSNFCDLSNSEYTGTNKCKTLAPTPTILITPTLTPQQWCAAHPTDAICLTPTPTHVSLSCDANRDGVTNDADYTWWYQEFTGQKTTKQADCNNDGVVDVVDFNIWRDVAVLHLNY